MLPLIDWAGVDESGLADLVTVMSLVPAGQPG